MRGQLFGRVLQESVVVTLLVFMLLDHAFRTGRFISLFGRAHRQVVCRLRLHIGHGKQAFQLGVSTCGAHGDGGSAHERLKLMTAGLANEVENRHMDVGRGKRCRTVADGRTPQQVVGRTADIHQPRTLMSLRQRMTVLHTLLLSIALSIALFIAAAPATAQSARTVVAPAASAANPTLSAGIRVGNMVFASGQLGLNRTAPDTTIGGQTRLALESTKKVFEAAGTSMANAVKCTVFLIDVKDFAAMNTVYREFFPSMPPARSTVVVAALVAAGAKIEVECSAFVP